MATKTFYPLKKNQRIGRSGKLRVGRNKWAYGRPGSEFNRFQINDVTAFIPEVWAMEGIRVLTENMVYGTTINRDFDDKVAQMGEVVHTRRHAELLGKRKQNDLDDVETQDVSATDVQVKLNQRVYAAFMIGDGDRSKTMTDLVNYYLVPAMRGPARLLDQAIGGQVYQFLDNSEGGLGQLASTNSHDYLLDMRGKFNDLKMGPEGRWLGLASPSETTMQKTDLFKSAERIGDAGQALRNALLGRVAGFETFLELNTPSVRNATERTATTLTANAAAGDTVINVASAANITVGNYLIVAGDYVPHRVTGIATLAITLDRPLKRAVSSGAAVTPYQHGLVNQASAIALGQTHAAAANGYPANWMKEIVYDGTATPKQGQLVSFATAGGATIAGEYAIVQVDTTAKTILLDRPLDNSVADNDLICFGPNGDYNFAYQKDAMTLVNRPMALPIKGSGVLAGNAKFEGISLSVKISYDAKKEGHLVVVTGLFGVAVLDVNRGGVLLG